MRTNAEDEGRSLKKVTGREEDDLGPLFASSFFMRSCSSWGLRQGRKEKKLKGGGS
jgi:hypothetical protein